MEIMEGMFLENKEDKILRVVSCNRLSSIIYVIEIDSGRRFPYPIEMDVITSAIQQGEMVVITDDPFVRYVVEDELSVSEKQRRDKAWKVVMHVLEQMENEQQMFLNKYRQKAMKNTMAVFQVQYNTVKGYLIEYWRGGKEKNGLLPKYYQCGARGRDKTVGLKKRGRPKKYGNRKGININDEIKKFFNIGLNRYYYTSKQNTLKFAYEMTIKDFFTQQKEEVNGVIIPIIQEEIPTYHQFLYHYRKTNNLKNEITKRKGSRIYYQQYRSIIGNSTQDSGLGPGTLWQTDSTPLSVTCVSSINRTILVGNPLLHIVMDCYSRIIVGFSLSFESLNSYSGAMSALLISMTSKRSYCEKYGLEIGNTWDIACIPHRIFTDRGELNGKQIESAIEGLGISIQNSSSYRPDFKGQVEQALNRIELQIGSLVDGASASRKRVRERGESDARLKANLTIDELTIILIKCIIFHNNHHVLEEYVLTEEMVRAGVEKVPKSIWEFGVKHHKGILRTLPEEVIKFHLMPEYTASITARGVKFKQMYYASEFSLKNNWFESARMNGNKRIKIKVDVRDMTEIYTINEEGKQHTLKLIDQYEKYRGKSIEEVEQIIVFEKEMETKSKQKELQEKMKLFNEVEEIMHEVRKSAEEERDVNISKSRRIKGIKENRKEERELQRALLKEEKEVEELEALDDSAIEEIKDDDDELAIFRNLKNE
ncbi:DDE-type integrase/transposase/recombinase [Psychrobacillus sp. PGGUH221]|uniref:hypothetical protein n=1 Tax=Psychrobacillus sp. PGGUH221 TaxID=3020058 RepID=UPI0035C6E28D